MIFDLKTYPAMRDSGVPWLGNVPGHWTVLPNRALFKEVKERDHPEEQMLSVTITKGVIPQKTLLADSSKKDSSNQDKSAYKVVRSGDIAYNKMRAWQGAIGVSDYQGIVSPAYVVQRPRDGAHPRYFHYLLRTPSFAKEAERWSYGITSDMWSLRPEHFKMIYGCLPFPNEQATIVRYLDHMDRRIRKYIRVKQKLIKLLEEQKQAIIHHAVTRGLDPNVRLKPSAVEWLEDVPEHWEVWPLCAIARMKSITGKPGRELLSVYLDRGVIRFSEVDEKRTNVTSEDLSKYQVVDPGDFVLNNQQAWRGSVGVSKYAGIISPAYLVLSLDGRIDPAYANLLFREKIMVDQYLVCSRGVGSIQRNLYWPSLRRVFTLLPSRSEQSAIVRFLDKATESVMAAISQAHREIALLHEYRTRLIADVVTGKLDVREAAVRLPEEGEKPEPPDEADAVNDAEEEPEVVEEPEE